jgi:hypothetical protein
MTIAGFSKILLVWLEDSSHDAVQTGDAMPNRHLANAALDAQIMFKRGFHFYLTPLFKRIRAFLSNILIFAGKTERGIHSAFFRQGRNFICGGINSALQWLAFAGRKSA